MFDRYIINGTVASEEIVYDIKNRKLSRLEIQKLAADPKISSGFIGTRFNKRKEKKYWNKQYLESLMTVAVAESFNLDYLLYLDEVADFITKEKNKKILIGIAIVVVVVIVGVIVFTYMLSGGKV